MTKYAVLLGHGIFTPSRPEYKRYADKFIQFANKTNVDCIVLCGGHTDPKRPRISEAMSLKTYLKKFLNKNTKILLEQRSLTTGQHIRFSKNLINLKDGNQVVVFSDNIRQFKILWLIMHYWFGLNKKADRGLFLPPSDKLLLQASNHRKSRQRTK
jgi:uncharacterized SAM-binding protein YcdF (DUF218 family)